MSTDYNKLKVTELKDLFKDRGISSTGLSRKQQMVDALEAEDAKVGDDVGGEKAVTSAGMDVDEKADEKVLQEGANGNAAMADATQPIVLERDQPVSTEPSTLATPNRTSPVPDDASSDTRKRKRRSVTPPVSAESVNKKLKAAEEDEAAKVAIANAPAPLDGAGDAKEDNEKTIQPYGISDDVINVDTQSTGAVHPATRAIYIRDLIRPIQPNQLQDHLFQLATTSDGTPSIETFHLDTLRTHAFAVFASLSDASRVRSKLHSTVFPDEPTRRPLFVDFVPEEKVQEWIDIELSSGTSRRDAKRWEVVYSTNDSDGVTCRLTEVSGNTMPAPNRQPSFNTQQQAPPPQRPSLPPPSRSPEAERRPTHAAAPVSKSFNILDERFQSTDAKPKLYFLPKDSELAADRMEELKRQTSRDWTGPSRQDFEGPQLRRYTFEDGHHLVDNGPDRGSFGVPEFARGGGGFGGGRGRGRDSFRR